MSRNEVQCSKDDNVLTVFTRSAKIRSVTGAGERVPLISTGAMRVAGVFCALFRSLDNQPVTKTVKTINADFVIAK